MISAARQLDVLSQIESRYVELLEGLYELEARVAATLETVGRRKNVSPTPSTTSDSPREVGSQHPESSPKTLRSEGEVLEEVLELALDVSQ